MQLVVSIPPMSCWRFFQAILPAHSLMEAWRWRWEGVSVFHESKGCVRPESIFSRYLFHVPFVKVRACSHSYYLDH